MRRIAIQLEYDGTEFLGWQLQKKGRTVQGAVEEAAARATGAAGRVPVHGAGRTDAGVHAAGQMAHFDTDSRIDPGSIADALNYWLPDDVSVLAAAVVPQSFHARFAAIAKRYRYRVLLSPVPRPLRDRYALRVGEPIDAERMKLCAAALEGKQDFACFTSAGSSVRSTVRKVRMSRWVRGDEEWHYLVEADGFTYHMVRAMVGTMLAVGRHRFTVEEVRQLLVTGDRSRAGPTAPARGLCLMKVYYEQSPEFDLWPR